ncbi:hypothetical protein POVCU1_001640 [Plasmodium ovale curtisi]|uniref:Uncharacterized protein n=1 Tax=Plasmodium ovale curtisi TaxID=864141 RepID=A0A1A8VJ94_PLAOA|nr:hypothetical protein POVCU1_001640 [Plasmodium ovale curtisi]
MNAWVGRERNTQENFCKVNNDYAKKKKNKIRNRNVIPTYMYPANGSKSGKGSHNFHLDERKQKRSLM